MKKDEGKAGNPGVSFVDDPIHDLATFETYVILKKADPKDEIEMTDILNFCASDGYRPCDKLTHKYCTFIPLHRGVFCKKNPLERDYRKFIAKKDPVTKAEYLLMRLAQAHDNLN